jgi:hypothetical protein
MANLTKITHDELKERLRSGSAKFFFRKVQGDLRMALGTLDLNRIPNQNHPKGGIKPENTTAYYDLEKGAWRSVSESQEIWV